MTLPATVQKGQNEMHIGPTKHFGATAVMAVYDRGFHHTLFGGCESFAYHLGYWINVQDRYLGLRFMIHGKVRYGWARLSVSRSFPTATLTGYAYETIAGKSIKAGQTKEADDPTNDFSPNAYLTTPIRDEPQPASLGMLALGAPGIPLWRRKESVDATQ